MTVGVIGLGKLGLPFALTFARAGAQVLAWDSDPVVRDSVSAHVALTDEPEVVQMLERHPLTLATADEIARRAHVIFIVVPTDSLPDGSFDNSRVLAAIEELSHGAQYNRNVPVLAVVSTVSPGALTAIIAPATRRHQNMRLVYTPTLIALGSVVEDLERPDVQIVGYSDTDPDSALVVSSALRMITTRTPPLALMSYESAAVAKLALNVFVTMKISFANMLARLCDDHLADVDDVTSALGHDQRIGHLALRAGAGFGGPCFPRDVAAFLTAGGRLLDPAAMNDMHLGYVVRRIRELTSVHGTTFTVLGREYKAGTRYRIASFGDRLVEVLTALGGQLVDHVLDADLVVVAQPLHEVNLAGSIKKGALVYDLWRQHEYLLTACGDDVTYVQLGRGVAT
jgi:UDPglucose 6-dehydrogenase